MKVLAGLFLVAHGLVHLAIWLPNPREDAPFDPGVAIAVVALT